MIETVYKLRDNPNTVTFSEDGVVIDFSAATRMVLTLKRVGKIADTNDDAALIDWSQGGGVVEFNLNDIVITSKSDLYATLVVYDALHTDGQILAHMDDKSLGFKFKDS